MVTVATSYPSSSVSKVTKAIPSTLYAGVLETATTTQTIENSRSRQLQQQPCIRFVVLRGLLSSPKTATTGEKKN